jgi:hypothetical protein
MASYYSLLLVVPVLFVVVQDFRSREVGLLWLILLCAGSLCCAFLTTGLRDTLLNVSLNILLLLYMAAGAVLWLWLKNRIAKKAKADNHAVVKRKTSEYMGMGDIVFVVAVAPLFLLKEFAVFLIVSSAISLLWWIFMGIIAKSKRPANIPFIGTSGIVFCAFLTFNAVWR